MADSPVTEGQILAGKYRVEKVLGSGGMGVVVAAWHLELEQRVAVKFLHPLALERTDTAERFRREARSAAKIRSEHVARVIDVGIMEGGVPYMVMEYLEGHDISDEMQKHGMLPIADAIDFVLQAIEALAEAHAAGIVHRDLKPANLFIAHRADGTRIVKVLDFGISKSLLGGSVAELSLTRTSTLIGSPLYMSPEQMRSAKDVDTRTDIWSLGVILYEMITGQPPYSGDSIPALCASLLNDTPVSMQTVRAEVPRLDITRPRRGPDDRLLGPERAVPHPAKEDDARAGVEAVDEHRDVRPPVPRHVPRHRRDGPAVEDAEDGGSEVSVAETEQHRQAVRPPLLLTVVRDDLIHDSVAIDVGEMDFRGKVARIEHGVRKKRPGQGEARDCRRQHQDRDTREGRREKTTPASHVRDLLSKFRSVAGTAMTQRIRPQNEPV